MAIEEQLLVNIGKYLGRNKDKLNEVDITAWQVQQIRDLDRLTKENIRVIAKSSGLAIEEINKVLEESGYGTAEGSEAFYLQAVESGLLRSTNPITQSMVLQSILWTFQKQALDKFNLVNTTLLRQSQLAYLNIVNQTVAKVITGTITGQEALRQTAKQFSDIGVPALIDKAGKKWSTEAYVNMLTRTMSGNIANEMQDARMTEYNIDLIEVSSHLGARPNCAPYQGRIYSRDGISTVYPPLSGTSYGQANGLRGVNCGHYFYPYIDGVSKQKYKPYDKKKNSESYNLSQEQRQLERNIRHAKREYEMMKAMGNVEGVKNAQELIKKRQLQMREFISETGRTRRNNREQIV